MHLLWGLRQQAKTRERVNAIDLAAFVIPAYSKYFTLDELRQILAFYQSPIGQIGRDITREILAEHPEYIAQIRANRAKIQTQARFARVLS